jgi:peptidase E
LNMLLIWRQRSIDTILREAVENGTILCGVSAGSICWFDSGVADSLAAHELLPIKCLGWLPGSNCPHYDSEAGRRPALLATSPRRPLEGEVNQDAPKCTKMAVLGYELGYE